MTEKSQAPESEALSQAKKDQTPIYEIGFHVVPTLIEENVPSIVEKIHGALGKAEIISEKMPERMVLAYTIERSVQGKREKYQDSYFGFIKFALDRSGIPGLQTALRAMPEVLRFIIVSTVREETLPRREVFSSGRLEGEVIKKPEAPAEKPADVSEEELDKSIDALVSNE